VGGHRDDGGGEHGRGGGLGTDFHGWVFRGNTGTAGDAPNVKHDGERFVRRT